MSRPSVREEDLSAYSSYMIDSTRQVIESFGPRPPGSEAERKCQEFNRTELEKTCDRVSLEDFQVRPGGFFGWLPVVCVLGCISMGLYFVLPWAALATTVLAMAIMTAELVLYKQFIDPFFPARTSYNVYGTVAPKGEIRRRIIIGGHADAAYEWRYAYHSSGLLKGLAIPAVVGLFVILATDGLNVILHGSVAPAWDSTWGLIGLGRLAFAPFIVASMFFSNYKVVVPGANDNLSGAYAALAAAKFMRENDIHLQNTEIVYMVTGSEEAGLRGAKAYVARHGDELKATPTVFLALETLREVEHLAIYARDMNSIVKHDPRVCALLKEAGTTCGFDLQYESVYLGSTDATAFTQAGISAAGLAAMDPTPADYYHTRRDNWDNMSADALEAGLRIVLEAVLVYDEQGLSD